MNKQGLQVYRIDIRGQAWSSLLYISLHKFLVPGLQYCGLKCAVPENIHSPPTKGIGISWGVGGSSKNKKFKEMYQV